MDDEQILSIVHQTAAEMMASNYGEVTEYGPADPAAGIADTDSLIDRYGFSSIDTLQCLLILEEKFGITLPDEDLNEEVLSSAVALAKRIGELQQAQAADARTRVRTLEPRLPAAAISPPATRSGRWLKREESANCPSGINKALKSLPNQKGAHMKSVIIDNISCEIGQYPRLSPLSSKGAVRRPAGAGAEREGARP